MFDRGPKRRGLGAMIGVASLAGVAGHAGAALIEVVAAVGAPAPGTEGLLVTSLNAPFTDGRGRVGLTGAVDDGGRNDHFVWWDEGVIWRNRDGLPTALSGAESTMGVSDSGGFIYSPSADGDDAVWWDQGLLLKEDQVAPGFPDRLISFCSRPTMVADGTAHFVSGLTDRPGGSTDARVLYRAGASLEPVLASGDVIEGFAIAAPDGVDFDYDFSTNGDHHIQVLLMETGSLTDDGFVYVDGALVARETEPTGQGDNWDNFDLVSVNDAGHHVFSGDTDGEFDTDEFIAFDGDIVLRRGTTVHCVTLELGRVQASSLNDLDEVVHLWLADGHEALFFGNARDLAASSRVVLQNGDTVDTDGAGGDDATVVDFTASGVVGPGLSLAEDGFVFVGVDLVPLAGGDEFEAILRVRLPDLDCLADVDGDGVVAFGDILEVLTAWGDCPGCRADVDGDCTAAFSDILPILAGWGPCPE